MAAASGRGEGQETQRGDGEQVTAIPNHPRQEASERSQSKAAGGKKSHKNIGVEGEPC